MSKADALAHCKGIACSKVSKADTFAHFKGTASTCNGSKAEASKANAVLDINIEKSKYTTRRDAIHSCVLAYRHTHTYILCHCLCTVRACASIHTHSENTLPHLTAITAGISLGMHAFTDGIRLRMRTTGPEAHVNVAERTPDRGWGGL